MKTSSTQRRPALTLMELVVVLVILVALGGIAVSVIPNLLNRTHVATVATNLPSVDQAVRQHMLLNSGAIGNNFDSLIVGTTNLDGDVADFVNRSGSYAAYSLTANDVSALTGLGITHLVPAQEGVNATFESHLTGSVPLASGEKVCVLSDADAIRILDEVWNKTPDTATTKYVVVGLGQRCTLVGAGEDSHFAEPPVHFVDAHTERAENSYARIMLVIELANFGTPEAEARYIGAGAPHPDGIQGVATHLKEYYSN